MHNNYTEDYLAHHGILGMKWGVRKQASNYDQSQRNRDKEVYGKGGVKRINKSMVKGNSISTARSQEKTHRDSIIKKNKYYRQGGKVVGAAGSAAVTFFGLGAAAKAISYGPGKAFVSKIIGTQNTEFASQILDNPTVKIIASGAAAKTVSMASGDAAVMLNMKAHGLNSKRAY